MNNSYIFVIQSSSADAVLIAQWRGMLVTEEGVKVAFARTSETNLAEQLMMAERRLEADLCCHFGPCVNDGRFLGTILVVGRASMMVPSVAW
eukprot:3736756-Amphidinium_carterae.1